MDDSAPHTNEHKSDEQHESKPADRTSHSVFDQPTEPKTDLEQTVAEVTGTEKTDTVTLVWQWLTYGLWTWTLGCLSVLLTATLAYFIADGAKASDSTWVIYLIATEICLLPIAFYIDKVYSKKEPEQKHGFAGVILVVHAVFAFLVSVGSLITAVVTLLSIATDTTENVSSKVTVIISALLIAALGALFFTRIVRPAKLRGLTRRFGLIVTGIAAITIVAAIAGPYIATIQSKSDRQIEDGLYGVNQTIQNYANTNKKLPASLQDLKFDTYEKDAKKIVDKGLVTYTKKASDTVQATTYPPTYSTTRLHYELCVTYKKAKGSGSVVRADTYGSDNYIDTYSHPAGHICYDQSVSTTSYYNENDNLLLKRGTTTD